MSMFIRGSEAPEDCFHCKFDGGGMDGKLYCNYLDKFVDFANDFKDMNCPISYVPNSHGRLIDADKIFNAVCKSNDIDDESKSKLLYLILESPTVIEEE